MATQEGRAPSTSKATRHKNHQQNKLHKQNQVHPPLPKKERVDGIGNDRGRLWYKDGNSTMLVCRATENEARKIKNDLIEIMNALHVKLEGTLFYTR